VNQNIYSTIRKQENRDTSYDRRDAAVSQRAWNNTVEEGEEME
jgi:hypothetical protein